MPTKRPTTIAEYIKGAPPAGQSHLRRLHAILKSLAPHAEEEIKWGIPFFVEPRFVFSFSAYKKHLNFTPPLAVMKEFAKELEKYRTTKGSLQVSYSEPLPEALVRKMAKQSIRLVRQREDDAFW